MKNPREIFHAASYLQYPLLLVMLFYVVLPYIEGFERLFSHYNNALIFAGLGISFSSLQDTTKTQNRLSKRIWEDPKKGRTALLVLSMMAFAFILFGIFGLYSSQHEVMQDLSLGAIVLGIGLISMLKVAIEMFENHRLDRNGPGQPK